MVTYTYNLETCTVTITGQDVAFINLINQKVRAENGFYGINRPYRRPFLPLLPKGESPIIISKNLDGTSTLTIKCKDKDGLGDLFYVLGNKFDIEYSCDKSSGTIKKSSPENLIFTPYVPIATSSSIANPPSNGVNHSPSSRAKKQNGIKH